MSRRGRRTGRRGCKPGGGQQWCLLACTRACRGSGCLRRRDTCMKGYVWAHEARVGTGPVRADLGALPGLAFSCCGRGGAPAGMGEAGGRRGRMQPRAPPRVRGSVAEQRSAACLAAWRAGNRMARSSSHRRAPTVNLRLNKLDHWRRSINGYMNAAWPAGDSPLLHFDELVQRRLHGVDDPGRVLLAAAAAEVGRRRRTEGRVASQALRKLAGGS